MSDGLASAPRGPDEERCAREHGLFVHPFFSCFVWRSSLSLTSPSLPPLSLQSKKNKMSFAMTANFFYAVVVAGLAYNAFILYAGASAAKLALRK